MRDTIDMAREALVVPFFLIETNDELITRLKDFEALVRADAIANEREACAKVCDELYWPWHIEDTSGPKECAKAIRARGNT